METLHAEQRNRASVNPRQVRKLGKIPAVLYGHKLSNVNLAVDGRKFALFYQTAGETTIVNLEIEGEKTKRSVLVHDVSKDPISRTITHVDFYQVRMDEKIKTHIPLLFEGESSAVKSDGGVLVKNIYKVEIEALPSDLPHEIKVDISSLKTFSDVITIGDLNVSDKVKIYGDTKEVIAKVIPPRTESELEALKEEVVMKVDDIKVETEEKKKEREAAKLSEKESEK